jgi:molybdopterin converting factor small subunit
MTMNIQATKPITVLYFGDLMAQLSIGREQFRLPPNVKDVTTLMRMLALRGGDWKKAFDQPRATLRITVNKKDADAATTLNGGDEVAFIEMLAL